MDKLDIMLWVISAGFAILFSLMMFMWHAINSKIENVEKHIDRLETKMDRLETKMDKFNEKLTSIDKEVSIITATLKFNGFDLDRHKASGE